MKNKRKIPESYFEEQEFLEMEVDEEVAVGVLGKNPSPDQFLKFELCGFIARYIEQKKLSLAAVEKKSGVNLTDISRIKNHHLDRFTIDRLLKIYTTLVGRQGAGKALEIVGHKIQKLSA